MFHNDSDRYFQAFNNWIHDFSYFHLCLWLIGNRIIPTIYKWFEVELFLLAEEQIKSTCTRKVSFFPQKFFFFICASHGFCMQKLSFLTKYGLILLSLDRIMAKKPFSAFFENFCSFCPRFIFSDARSFPKTSKGCILSI